MINRAFRNQKNINEIVWYFIGVDIINRKSHHITSQSHQNFATLEDKFLNSARPCNILFKFEFHAVMEQDSEKIVKHIPSNKAPGHDRVSARVLEDSLPATLPVITNLINSSFASKCFAQAWKSAVVIPNLKSGDPDEPENTRPISPLPVMSKVCERAAHT